MIDLDQLTGALNGAMKGLEDIVSVVDQAAKGMDKSKFTPEQLSEIEGLSKQTDDLIKKAPEMISQVERLMKQKR